jgi:hypothetical protein
MTGDLLQGIARMSYSKNRPAADFEYQRQRRAHVIVCSPRAIRRVTADDPFQFVCGQIANCHIHDDIPPRDHVTKKFSELDEGKIRRIAPRAARLALPAAMQYPKKRRAGAGRNHIGQAHSLG